MSDVVEGRNAVLEALRAEAGVLKVMLAEGVRPGGQIDEILELARASGIPVERVPKRDIDRMSARGAHQGVLATTRPFEYTELRRVLESRAEDSASLIVALDHVTDPGNLGAVVRSVEAAGGHAVIIPKDRSAPVSPVAHKAAAGATAYLPIVRVTNLARALGELKDAGYWVAGAVEDAPTSLWEAPVEGRLVIVMGAEGEGLSRLVSEACDLTVSIPMNGRVGSLNVAQATSVLAFEWVRRRVAGEE